MSDSADETHTPTLSEREAVLLEKQVGTARSFPSLREMAESNTAFLVQSTSHKQEIVDEAGGSLRPAYKLSRVPERTAATNRSYLESYFERKHLATPLRSAYAVSSAVHAFGETNEKFHRQSAPRVD
jgi:hypothetical protein